MKNIEKLYYNMENLSDNWGDMPETRKANKELENALGRKLYMEHEEKILAYMVASEKQGFIRGFQYAVSLLTSKEGCAV